MADSGDWITPRLWGTAWFEKPALLYWMTAAGFKAGLGPDLAPRLPVALLSVCFLIYFFLALRRAVGLTAASYATAILATCAGWLAYSRVAVTDLPMSAAFAAAMLVVLNGPLRGGVTSVTPALIAGILLGFAVLAKGLVPIVLFLPAVWFLRRHLRDLLCLSGAALVIALPWYALVTLRNGAPFLNEFFWKHHFERFTTTALQHPQPFWFYVPVLAAGLFPWSPLLFLLFQRRLYTKNPAPYLLAWISWGFLFFSLSRNKLPGYLLPLMPAVASLAGIALAQARQSAAGVACALAASAALLSLVPAVSQFLPHALIAGASHTPIQFSFAWVPSAVVAAVLAGFLEMSRHRAAAVAMIALFMTLSIGSFIGRMYPQLDRLASARFIWNSSKNSMTCGPPSLNRAQRYGLYYYAGVSLPDCNR
ncbi:MAG TPA: glycosyltransferase family 39 protein [Candidatus Binataceae bacterium]|nr:glycosyltransferase family 39 protein [Candidatus Binataceae bacterium]